MSTTAPPRCVSPEVWYHRRWLIGEMKDPGDELAVAAEAIRRDSKTNASKSVLDAQHSVKSFKYSIFINDINYKKTEIILQLMMKNTTPQRII